MFRITGRRLATWLVVGALFYAGLQYVQVYFYASGFSDYIKDAVMFAPARESTEKDRLTTTIMEGSKQYGVEVEPSGIKIRKVHNYEDGIDTLIVDVSYASPIDLRFFKPVAHFHTNATITY